MLGNWKLVPIDSKLIKCEHFRKEKNGRFKFPFPQINLPIFVSTLHVL